MDPLQIAFLLVLLAIALVVLVQWIGYVSYWRSRQAIRDELTAIADDAERLKQNEQTHIKR